jgi:hypothetical protein
MDLKKLASIVSLAISLGLTQFAAAQTLTGTVTNGTTNKPGAGDEVILISLGNGMEPKGSVKADSNGKFSFNLPDAGPHLIRAVHQGVTYHQMAPPGTNSVDVKVYDVVKKIDGLSVTADVMRFQADGGQLQGTRLFAVSNNSSPAKTQMNDHNFEFFLPAGAKLEEAQAKAPNGQPISAETAPQAEKNKYAVVFPLRPGETQIQIQYTMPYSGELTVDPKPLYPAEHVVVVLPKSMTFKAAKESIYQNMQDPNSGDSSVQVAQQTQPGQTTLGFTISGTGTISDSPQQVAAGAAQQQGSNETRPGGGLGPPIDAPDPLSKYRWPIIGAFLVLLGVGAWYVTKRPGAATASATASGVTTASAPINPPKRAVAKPAAATPGSTASAPPRVAPAVPTNSSNSPASMLLEGLKEEMFQLELERKQGHISQAEYEKAKAAFDVTLERALKRKG